MGTTIKTAAEEFADWCHATSQPRPVMFITFSVWLLCCHPAASADKTFEKLCWERFRLIWTTHRRHA